MYPLVPASADRALITHSLPDWYNGIHTGLKLEIARSSPAALAGTGLVGAPLHLRHLLQDAIPPVHQEQVYTQATGERKFS